MAKEGIEEGPTPAHKDQNGSTQRTGRARQNPFATPNIEYTQRMDAVQVERIEKEPTPELEPKAATKVNVIANILWFLFFVGLMWVSDVAGEAFPTPIDDMLYDAAIATLFGILASFGIFTKRK